MVASDGAVQVSNPATALLNPAPGWTGGAPCAGASVLVPVEVVTVGAGETGAWVGAEVGTTGAGVVRCGTGVVLIGGGVGQREGEGSLSGGEYTTEGTTCGLVVPVTGLGKPQFVGWVGPPRGCRGPVPCPNWEVTGCRLPNTFMIRLGSVP
jgi:hypothetical protein